MKPGPVHRYAFRALALAGLACVAACERAPDPLVEAPQRGGQAAPVSAPALTPALKTVTLPPPAAPFASDQPNHPPRLPLARILAKVQAHTPGEVLEVELDEDDGIETYEINILTANDRTIEVTIDARSGQILKREED